VTKLTDARTVTEGQTVVGVFPNGAKARDAVRSLERAGMPSDRVGVVRGNVRQAREVAGSYSPQGAITGAVIAAILIAAFVVFGYRSVSINPVGIVLGGFALLVALTAIGWLAGRARVFKREEYEDFEDDVASGETLVQVVCGEPESVDQVRALLERAGADQVRFEDTAESV
jgi:hypothetical protein